MATLETAIKKYADELFAYLHEENPEAFVSATPVIDRVIVSEGERYPLRVDVTFNLLYNEAPEDAPRPEEVGAILQDAFTSEEFIYFYLWGRRDMWDNVSSVQVVARPDEPNVAPEEPSGPNVDVYATMLYDFGVDPTQPPSEEDYATVVAQTKTFFRDVLTSVYRDNTYTTFLDVIITREATMYDISITPPVAIDFKFEVQFDPSSEIFPSSSELFDIMAAGDQMNFFDSYIRVYLQQNGGFWAAVSRVGFLETPKEEAPPPGEIGVPTSAYRIRSSVIYSFFPGTASRPSKENYDTLGMVTNFFFTETLRAAFNNTPAVGFQSASSTLEGSYYTEGSAEPLQVDFTIEIYFEGAGVESEERLFNILQTGNYEDYIMNYLWPEGAPWRNINGVMFIERIAPPTTGTASPGGTTPPITTTTSPVTGTSAPFPAQTTVVSQSTTVPNNMGARL